MSCSLYRWTEECEGQPCVGDCDLCRKETMIDKYDEVGIPTNREVEADGFITRAEDLERVAQNKAKPIDACAYPLCEECDKYHGHYCTVPMVVSKQIYLFVADELGSMEKKIAELESLVMDEIFGSAVKSYTLHDNPIENPPEVKITKSEEANYTWADYLGEDK